MEKISGTILAEKQRWHGNDNDTVVAVVRTPDRDVVVKCAEKLWPIRNGAKRVFWGQMQGYRTRWRNEPQLAAFCYTDQEHEGSVEQLLELLLGRGFPRDLAATVVYEWGPQAQELVLRNPYLLTQFPRVGFKLADKLWLELGKPAAKLKRQTLCGVHWLRNADGSIWHRAEAVHQAIRESVGAADVTPARAVTLGVRAGVMASVYSDAIGSPSWDGDVQWVADGRLARVEQQLAATVREFERAPCRWPEIEPWPGGEHQHEQLRLALASPVGMLLGGAGTGKTYTVARVIASLEKSGAEIAVAAPTGKAAVRLTEALSELGVGAKARTLHSLMGFDGSKFAKAITAQYLFIDESSMVDLELMHAVFEHCARGTHILLIGDPYQLPPVGPGAPLRDLAGLIATGTLTEVRRNSGAIVAAGVQMREGKRFAVCDVWDQAEQNLVHLPATTEEHSILQLQHLYEQLGADAAFDPIWDLQVVCAVNAKSRLGCIEINRVLQQQLNPRPPVPNTPFRVGDKVMQSKNGWLLPAGEVSEEALRNKAGEVYVANGEFGIVVDIQDRSLIVRMLAPVREVRVGRYALHDESEEKDTGSSLQLAYAITVHKSQGSQAPHVAYMLDPYPGARRLTDRSLVYTAITRAKRATWLVGSLDLAHAACRRAAVFERKTYLAEAYRGQI